MFLYSQPKCSCDVHGICVYFSVEFGGGGSAEKEEEKEMSGGGGGFSRLDSSPWGEPTHWQQSVMLFKVRTVTSGRARAIISSGLSKEREQSWVTTAFESTVVADWLCMGALLFLLSDRHSPLNSTGLG